MSIAQEQPASAKYEAFLDARLNQARQQVRWMDIGVGAVGLAALTLGYALIMLVLDRELHLPTYVRQISLLGFLAFAAWYVLRVLLIPLRTQVNPYYAAKKVEHVLPQSKNSLVSWLDLRDRQLAEPIRDAIGRKAANDLSRANVHDAVRDRRLARAGMVMTLLGVITLGTLLAIRPPQFFSLLDRAFLPFRSTPIATQTVIKLIEPAGGDTTVSVNQSVFIRVEVDGRNPKPDAPDSVRLKMRYQPSDPVWEERRLDPTDRAGEWRIQVPAASVRTGFEYQVVGGDAATSIYRVKVRAKAMITDFEVTYRYRPYLGFADDVRADPNLSAFRGTNVTLLAKTNRPVKDGVLKFAPNSGAAHPPLAAILMPDRPDTLKFVFQLDQSGKYRLQFTSGDAEASEETLPFDINVLPDLPPKVDFTKPVSSPLAANGIMFIHGKATDDFGLTSAQMIFRMRSAAGAQPEVLQSVPLRDRQSLTQPDGKLPRQLELKAAIPLESLVDAVGAKPTWAPGMVLEYAIEAEDNYDNPSPQIGRTPWESVTIGDPASKEQKQQAQDAADQLKNEEKDKQDQQQGNNGKQGNKGQGDKDQKNEDQSKDGNQDQGKGDKNEQGKGDQKQGNDDKQDGKQDQGKGDKNQPGKPDQKPANDAKQGDKQEGDNKSDNQQQKQQPLTPEEKKTLDAAKKLEDALRDEQKGDKPDANTEKKEGGDQPGDPNAHPDNKKEDQPKPGDKDRPQPEKGDKQDGKDKPDQGDKQGDKQDSKGQGQERKDGDKTDKQGEKPGKGEPNKSNDQDPKTSPDKGKEDGGKGSAERGGENKAGDKPDKPEDKAKSGQSDPKAKPKDDGKPDGAKSDAGKPGNDKGKSEPDSGAGDAKKDNRKPDQPGKLEDAPKDMKGGDNKTDAKHDGKSKQTGKPGDAKDKDQSKSGDKPSDGGEADRNEIQKMIENFKNADPKQQKEISDKLNDMAKNDPSQKTRDAAKEAMEKLDPNNGSNSKQGERDKAKPDAKPKDKSDQGKGEKPDSKPGEEQTGEGPAKVNPQKDAKDNAEPGEGPQQKTDQDKKKSADAPPRQGNQPMKPTQPGSGQPGGDTRGDVNSTSGKGLGAPNEGFSRQAGELQLDNFRNKVDRKVLDRAKMTDQEYQDFLKAYEKLVQKQKELLPQPGDRARGDAKGTSAANSGAKKVEGQAGGPKVDRTGRGTAPADIRDQYRDFTEQQAKQQK